jgi:transcription initiation factor IIE alpha subunit
MRQGNTTVAVSYVEAMHEGFGSKETGSRLNLVKSSREHAIGRLD